VPEGSDLDRHSAWRDLEAAAEADVTIRRVRDGRRRYGTARNLKLRAGDVLVIEADPRGAGRVSRGAGPGLCRNRRATAGRRRA
jgi:uncharacterized protein with PhoU and TrkA domain